MDSFQKGNLSLSLLVLIGWVLLGCMTKDWPMEIPKTPPAPFRQYDSVWQNEVNNRMVFCLQRASTLEEANLCMLALGIFI